MKLILLVAAHILFQTAVLDESFSPEGLEAKASLYPSLYPGGLQKN